MARERTSTIPRQRIAAQVSSSPTVATLRVVRATVAWLLNIGQSQHVANDWSFVKLIHNRCGNFAFIALSNIEIGRCVSDEAKKKNGNARANRFTPRRGHVGDPDSKDHTEEDGEDDTYQQTTSRYVDCCEKHGGSLLASAWTYQKRGFFKAPS